MKILKIAALTAAMLLTACDNNTPVSAAGESANGINAPFGLQWGQSKDQLEANGVQFSSCTEDGEFMICTTYNPPKMVSFIKRCDLSFHSSHGLHRIFASSKWFMLDRSGIQELYGQTKAALTEKYGTQDFEDESFGANQYATHWFDDSGAVIQLVVDGSGFMRIDYHSNKFKELDPNSDKHAL